MPGDPIPTAYYAFAVIRSADRFLLIQEKRFGQTWYLPGGRVDPGETFFATACRETLEEAGIAIVLDGILRIEHTPQPDGTVRLRVFLLAHPLDDQPPKSQADEHSLGAAWVALEDLDALALREETLRELLHYLAQGGLCYPLSLIAPEGTPFNN